MEDELIKRDKLDPIAEAKVERLMMATMEMRAALDALDLRPSQDLTRAYARLTELLTHGMTAIRRDHERRTEGT